MHLTPLDQRSTGRNGASSASARLYGVAAGVYALVCATAALAGVFRSAISLVVLVVEGTRSINFLFAIIVAVVAANFVSGVFEHEGVYGSEIEHDSNVAFLPQACFVVLLIAFRSSPTMLLPQVTERSCKVDNCTQMCA